MTNKKIKNAGFNLQMQAIVKDNWRFLAGICLVLSSEDIFGKAKWGKNLKKAISIMLGGIL